MKDNNQLPTSQKQLETEELNKYKLQEIKISLTFAIERTNLDLRDIDNTADDLKGTFDLKDIKAGIRFGSLGKYGINNRLNTQVVCSWVWKYKKEREFQG